MSQEFTTLKIATAVLPIVSGVISVLGSSTLISVMVRSEKKVSTTYRRLLLGMSCLDIIFSIACLSSTFPSPRNLKSSNWIAIGTTQTCTLQGLMIYVGSIGTTMYNSMLSIFYLLTIAFNVREDVMVKWCEPFFHAIPFLYLVSTSILLLVTTSFNTMGTFCGIASFPKYCNSDPDLECTRGLKAPQYVWYFQGYPIISMFVLIATSMIAVYCSVRVQEQKMEKYRMNHSTLPSRIQELRRASINTSVSTNHGIGSASPRQVQTPRGTSDPSSRNRRAAMIQCLCYVSAYFLTWIFTIILRVVPSGRVGNAIWLLANFFSPLQGFLNFLVFIRPQVKELRDFDNISIWKATIEIIKNGGMDLGTRRRRESLRDTQQNGGTRFTAREWHMRQAVQEEAHTEFAD